MNYIFISPNYPSGHWRYVAALRSAGHTVLGVGDAGDETFCPMLRGSLTEYIRVGDLHDYEGVYRACAYLISRHGRPDAIEALNPYWQDLVTALNVEFCTLNVSPDECYASITSRLTECEGLLPRWCMPKNASRALAFTQETSYPVLAVPTKDKGLNHRLLDSDSAVKSAFKKQPDNSWLLFEQYPGERVDVDGLCALDDDGNEVLVAVSAHLHGEDGSLLGIPLTDEQRSRIRDLVDSTVDCGFFHIEAVRLERALPGVGKKGALCFNSIIDCPPGELVVDCLNAEFERDLRAVWANGEELEAPLEQQHFGAVACRCFDRSYKNPHEKILRRMNIKLISHGKSIGSGEGCFGDYHYIFIGDSTAELRRSIKYITEDFVQCQ